MIPKMTSEEYVKNNGKLCPFCEEPELVDSDIEFDGTTGYANVKCTSCGAKFTDIYKLAGYDAEFTDYYNLVDYKG